MSGKRFAKFFENSKKRKASNFTKGKNSNQSEKKEKLQETSSPFQTRGKRNHKKARKEKNHGNGKRDQVQKSKKQQEWKPPTEEALALSAKLKELSSKKLINEALKVYWDPKNDNVRDVYHGGIMVDCCSRCGAVEDGEKIVEGMLKAAQANEEGNKSACLSVQVNTSLMKGYAHAGSAEKMEKAFKLFESMFASKNKRDHPNVRTLNTFLRGCLWSATVVKDGLPCSSGPSTKRGRSNGVESSSFSGGVCASESVWSLCNLKNENKIESNKLQFDVSSYEYSITLLCNALMVDKAELRIKDMINNKLLKEDLPSLNEGLASSYVNIARAHALLGQFEEGKIAVESALKCIDKSNKLIKNKVQNNISSSSTHIRTVGGKRAWSGNNDTEDKKRSESNILFREHRINEIRSEAKSLSIFLSECALSEDQCKLLLVRFLETRLIYLGGGGTTDLLATRQNITSESKAPHKSNLELDILRSIWFSFGLAEARGKKLVMPDARQDSLHAVTWGPDVKKILKQRKIFDEDGSINLKSIFTFQRIPCVERNKTEKDRPVFIELGSGSGDWITTQANANREVDYISVELRSDRVAQNFAKGILNYSNPKSLKGRVIAPALTNLCCVGAESGSFLQRIKLKSVERIYCNHPEPPIQKGEDLDLNVDLDNEEMGHMLNSKTLLLAAERLKPSGQGEFIVVTDNKWYANLIAKTFLKVMRDTEGLLASRGISTKALKEYNTISDEKHHITIFKGQPCETIGYYRPLVPNGQRSGTSYFDRLWRTGAGSYAEKLDRFIIVMQSV